MFSVTLQQSHSPEYTYTLFITFRMRHSQGEMYTGHSHLCVCLSLAAFPHYCMDLDVSWGNGRGCALVVHYWADLQSLHGFRCYDNIAPNAKCQRVLYAWFNEPSFLQLLGSKSASPTESLSIQLQHVFHMPDALPVIQPTASKHQQSINSNLGIPSTRLLLFWSTGWILVAGMPHPLRRLSSATTPVSNAKHYEFPSSKQFTVVYATILNQSLVKVSQSSSPF